MKMRNGFVSNSSSSSFIVFLDRVPKDPEDLKKMLWPDWNRNHPCVNIDTEFTKLPSKQQVLNRVFNDIMSEIGKEKPRSEILEHIGWNKLRLPNGAEIGEEPSEEENPHIKAEQNRMRQEVDKLEREWKAWPYIGSPWDYLDRDGKERKKLLPQRAQELVDLIHETRSRMWSVSEEYRRHCQLANISKINKYIKDKPVAVELEYSDNEQDEAALEHGNIFRWVMHVYQSNH